MELCTIDHRYNLFTFFRFILVNMNSLYVKKMKNDVEKHIKNMVL